MNDIRGRWWWRWCCCCCWMVGTDDTSTDRCRVHIFLFTPLVLPQRERQQERDNFVFSFIFFNGTNIQRNRFSISISVSSVRKTQLYCAQRRMREKCSDNFQFSFDSIKFDGVRYECVWRVSQSVSVCTSTCLWLWWILVSDNNYYFVCNIAHAQKCHTLHTARSAPSLNGRICGKLFVSILVFSSHS